MSVLRGAARFKEFYKGNFHKVSANMKIQILKNAYKYFYFIQNKSRVTIFFHYYVITMVIQKHVYACDARNFILLYFNFINYLDIPFN